MYFTPVLSFSFQYVSGWIKYQIWPCAISFKELEANSNHSYIVLIWGISRNDRRRHLNQSRRFRNNQGQAVRLKKATIKKIQSSSLRPLSSRSSSKTSENGKPPRAASRQKWREHKKRAASILFYLCFVCHFSFIIELRYICLDPKREVATVIAHKFVKWTLISDSCQDSRLSVRQLLQLEEKGGGGV